MYRKMLTIHSHPNNVLEVETYLKSVIQHFSIEESRYPDMLISLTEAVNNAIIHGNKEDEKKVVQIDCELQNQGLSFRVSDQGSGFNPDEVPDPRQEGRIECCGGRGVLIMSTLADELSFQNNGSTVEMYFKFKS